MKKDFLVAYDYGMGGIWIVLKAKSEEEIESRFPSLRVFESPPSWMKESDLELIESQNTYDVDEEPHGLFAQILKEIAEGK